MELPKNIVQIGKPDKTHKIFVEDYVVSYMKQLNKECGGKPIGLALYGKYFEENDCKYYFLYGAARVAGIEHRGPYLSAGEQEEIADIGRKYFGEYRFLAWCSLRGEPIEGFFVQTQGKGIQVDGYACFYEKNESMLNFMLQTGQKDGAEREPESAPAQPVGRGEWKAEDVKKTVPAAPPARNSVKKKTEYMKVAVAAVFLVLCVVGITTLNDYEKLEDLQAAARQVIAGMTEQKLPDVSMNNVSANTISENEVSANVSLTENQPVSAGQPLISNSPAADTQPVSDNQPAAESQSMAAEAQPIEVNAPTSYTILKGDTLISICNQRYGSLEKLAEICELNGITDADSIQIGQTILLP